MAIALLFWAALCLCCVYACVFGGKAGRCGAALFLLAVLGTVVATWPNSGWRHTNFPLFMVDSIYLAGLYVLAVRSGRFWPIWSAGFQLLAVLTHVGTMIDPFTKPQLYRALESFWALPILVTMVIGVSLDRKAGLYSRKVLPNDPVH